MTARKDPDVEREVEAFNYHVDRRDRIVRTCRRPTTCQKFEESGYHAAWHDVLAVIRESAGRHHCAGLVLEDLLDVARSVLETTWTEEYAERWASTTPASRASTPQPGDRET